MNLLFCQGQVMRFKFFLASFADVLLARHAIFSPQRTSAETPGGVLEVYMTGGSDGASYCKPKKIHKPEILDPKKYLASKFPTQKNTRLKYLNVHCIVFLISTVCPEHIAEKKFE